jgi:threonine dehydratase
LIPTEWPAQARVRIDASLRKTELAYDEAIQAWLKWENQQVTGSFKARGAFNRILSLEAWELNAGLVCASAGNHGQAVALAAQTSGTPVEVFVGANAAPWKIEKMKALGAAIRVVQGGYAAAERAGLEYAGHGSRTWVSPYNDAMVIAGQATLALEALEQLGGRETAVWIVPVGGGGLISGVGSVLAGQRPRPRLVGVQPTVNCFMHSLYYRGTQDGMEDLPSLADGLTGAVEGDSVTLPLVKDLVDDIVLVSEAEIAAAITYAWQKHHQVVEGSGAVSLAALLFEKVRPRPAVAIISGGNIDPALHGEIVGTSRAPEQK